jgi:ribosomal protein S27E
LTPTPPPQRPQPCKAAADAILIHSERAARSEHGAEAMAIKVSITTTRSGPDLSDAVTVPIQCPKCGHETEHSIAWLKTDPVLSCSACGEKLKIDSGGTLTDVANQLDNIDRLFDKITKS